MSSFIYCPLGSRNLVSEIRDVKLKIMTHCLVPPCPNGPLSGSQLEINATDPRYCGCSRPVFQYGTPPKNLLRLHEKIKLGKT